MTEATDLLPLNTFILRTRCALLIYVFDVKWTIIN